MEISIIRYMCVIYLYFNWEENIIKIDKKVFGRFVESFVHGILLTRNNRANEVCLLGKTDVETTKRYKRTFFAIFKRRASHYVHKNAHKQ